MPAALIVRQQVDFGYAGRSMSVVSDYRTPLYDTVAEVMDYDCYQLSDCDWTDPGGGIVVDAGANVGVSALALAGRFPGRIICLEPVPENLPWLQENLERNGVARAEVWPFGLAGHARRDWLWRDPEQSVSAHFNPDLAPGGATSMAGTEADFLTVSDILARAKAEQIVLLKMDIEGAEHEIMESFSEAIARRVRQITFEVHDNDHGQNQRSLCRRLQALGYLVTTRPERFGRKGLSHVLARR